MEIFLAPRRATLFIYTLNVSRALLGVEHDPVSGAAYRDDRECPGKQQRWGTSGSLHAGKRAATIGSVPEADNMTDKALFIEEIIINSLKSLLTGRVNELLGEMEYPIPPIEFGSYRDGSGYRPFHL
jgi:hypothetical protein